MKGKPVRPVITSRQLLYLLIGTTMPTESLLLPAPVIQTFGKDALWAILGGASLAIVPLLITLFILRRQQWQTLSEMLQRLGVFSHVIPLLFAIPAMLGLINIWASFAQLLRVDLLPRTPAWVTTASAAAAVIYGSVGGPEVVGRIAQALVPLFIYEVVMLFLLALPWLEPIHLMPLLPEHGFVLTLGIYQTFTFLAEVAFATYFGSLVRDRQGIPRALWTALSVNTSMLLLTTGMPLLMFGASHARILAVPPLTAVRAIHYGFLVERLDAFMAAPWAVFVSLKLMIWTVFASSLLSDTFGVRVYRWLVWGTTAAISLFSLRLGSLGAVQTNVREVWYASGAPLMLAALIIIAALALRRRGRRPSRA